MAKVREHNASEAPAVPNRVRALADAIGEEIGKLQGVVQSARSFRIGKKVFVRFSVAPDHVCLEFKLPADDAQQARRLAFVEPMRFGNMGRHGWVEVALAHKSELKAVARLVRISHALYRQH